jgi:hypothetical protein
MCRETIPHGFHAYVNSRFCDFCSQKVPTNYLCLLGTFMEVAMRSQMFSTAAVVILLSFPAEAAHYRHLSHSNLYPASGGATATAHRGNPAVQMPGDYGYDGPIFDGYGNRVGTYRGPILGYAGTSCEVLTPDGYRDVCMYDNANN